MNRNPLAITLHLYIKNTYISIHNVYIHYTCKLYIYIYIHMNIYALYIYIDIHTVGISKVKLGTVVEGDQEATTPRSREGCYSFPWISPLYP